MAFRRRFFSSSGKLITWQVRFFLSLSLYSWLSFIFEFYLYDLLKSIHSVLCSLVWLGHIVRGPKIVSRESHQTRNNQAEKSQHSTKCQIGRMRRSWNVKRTKQVISYFCKRLWLEMLFVRSFFVVLLFFFVIAFKMCHSSMGFAII